MRFILNHVAFKNTFYDGRHIQIVFILIQKHKTEAAVFSDKRKVYIQKNVKINYQIMYACMLRTKKQKRTQNDATFQANLDKFFNLSKCKGCNDNKESLIQSSHQNVNLYAPHQFVNTMTSDPYL